jgi:hypothetical protein
LWSGGGGGAEERGGGPEEDARVSVHPRLRGSFRLRGRRRVGVFSFFNFLLLICPLYFDKLYCI